MRLRWKLLILLLAMALTPLLIMAVRAQRATYRLGQEIGNRARTVLEERSEHQLRLFIAARAELLARDTDLVRMACELQAEAVERLLAADPPHDSTVHFSADYRNRDTAPAELAARTHRLRITSTGEREPLPVNTSGAVIHLAPDVSADTVRDDIQRLAALTPTYLATADWIHGLAYWQYAALANGVFSCFPGHGSYPPAYDPRQRDWYTLAVKAKTMRWTPPYADAATGQVMMSCVKPVNGPDGTLAGVVGIDVAVEALARSAELPWAQDARTFVVIPIPRQGFDPFTSPIPPNVSGEEGGLLVLAASAPVPVQPGAPVDNLHWLESDDTAGMAAFFDRLHQDEAGVVRMPYAGTDALWAFGRVLGRSACLVAILPYAEIETEANRAESIVVALTNTQLAETAAIFLGVVILVLLVAVIGSRAVTTPIRRLADGAQRIARGDLDARVPVSTRDEIGELGRTFNAMVPQLADRLRMHEALNVAMEVQQHLLPKGPPQIPGLDVAGLSKYCDETGGDYYDFLDITRVDSSTLGIAVGDVTGHGVAAALLMATGRALLRSGVERAENLARLIEGVNRHLSTDSLGGRFMTLCYLLIDMRDGTLRWVSAGHDAPIAYDLTTHEFRELEGGGLPLGVVDDWAYEEYADRLPAGGEVIVIGTDGIWEAANSEGTMYGKDRLRTAMAQHADAPADEIARGITADLAAFCDAAPQTDDITLVVIKSAPRPA